MLCKELYFAKFQHWVQERRSVAEHALLQAEAELQELNNITASTLDERQTLSQLREVASGKLLKSQLSVNWLVRCGNITTAPPRSFLTRQPTWSFAGNLPDVSRDVMSVVSLTARQGRGSKDDLPLVYISNPPRHGKSLLLDTLFQDVPREVCVLNATYNAATSILNEELSSPEGALCGLLTRLVVDLLYEGLASWEELWEASPLRALLSEAIEMESSLAIVNLFACMLGLGDSDKSAPAKLLICIDEISKLIDDPGNTWAHDKLKQKRYWRGLYSITRATSNWVRVVMTGFTDSPRDAVAASDVGCRPFHLSMITNAEKQVLSAELIWAHVVNNYRFPGLLWVIVKSTPGLLGLWAQQINLGSPLSDAKPQLAMDLANNISAAASDVPWIATLIRDASKNWPIIHKFLLNDDVVGRPLDVERDARNAGVATVLDKRPTLSPFAVAVTVMALRSLSPPVDVGVSIFTFLSDALRACEKHSAGCAAFCPVAWPIVVQRRLKESQNIVTASQLLQHETSLVPTAPDLALLGDVSVMPGVTVTTIGQPFEVFVLNALALRFQCILERTEGQVKASFLFPEAVGLIKRPLPHADCLPRHPAEKNIILSLCTEPDLDLARMCTQTAALLLPSSVSSMLDTTRKEDYVSRRLFQLSADLSQLSFSYKSVYVVPSHDAPRTFPVAFISPRNDSALHNQLVDELRSSTFCPHNFHRDHASESIEEVERVHDDVKLVTQLAFDCARDCRVILFQPTDSCNPMCDTIAIIPMQEASTVCFVFVELKDRSYNNFNKKVTIAATNELLLAAVAGRLACSNIQMGPSIYVCCGRTPVLVSPTRVVGRRRPKPRRGR